MVKHHFFGSFVIAGYLLVVRQAAQQHRINVSPEIRLCEHPYSLQRLALFSHLVFLVNEPIFCLFQYFLIALECLQNLVVRNFSNTNVQVAIGRDHVVGFDKALCLLGGIRSNGFLGSNHCASKVDVRELSVPFSLREVIYVAFSDRRLQRYLHFHFWRGNGSMRDVPQLTVSLKYLREFF